MATITIIRMPSVDDCQSWLARPEVQIAGILAVATGFSVSVVKKLMAKNKIKKKRMKKMVEREEAIRIWEEKLKCTKVRHD